MNKKQKPNSKDNTPNTENMFSIFEKLPKMGEPVIGYNLEWVDPDFNANGFRECFTYGDENIPGGEWHTAKWVDGPDKYVTTDEQPTHWFYMQPSTHDKAQQTDINEPTKQQFDLLTNALGECLLAAGFIEDNAKLTGPELLLLAEDLKSYLSSK